MPWTYEQFLKNTKGKGFTDEDRKVMNDFMDFAHSVTISIIDYKESIEKLDIPEAEKKTPVKALSDIVDHTANSPENDFGLALRMKEVEPGDERAKYKYESAGSYAETLFKFLEQKDILENYLDSSVYENGMNKNKSVEAYFKFAEMVNRCYNTNIDVDAQRRRYNKHLAQKQGKEYEGIDEAEEKQIAEYTNTAFDSYNKGSLIGRGSEQYAKIGTVFNDAVKEMKEYQDNFDTFEKSGDVNYRNAAFASLKKVLKGLDELRETTNAYYEYKRNDKRAGQWNEAPEKIANKNARARVMAAKKMDEFAERMREIYTRKLKAFEADMNMHSEELLDEGLVNVSGNVMLAADDAGNVMSINDYDDEIEEASEIDIRISDKEDPAFTKAVENDRKLIHENLSAISKSDKNIFTADTADAVRNGLAGVIAANLLSRGMDINSPAFRAEKNAQQVKVAESLKTLTDNGTLPQEKLIELADGAFTKHGAALVMDYGKLVKPVQKEDVTKSERNIIKSKNAPSI